MLVNGESNVVALLMHKTIMPLATLDGNTTVTSLKTNLFELMQYAIKQNGNINEIHAYFKQKLCPAERPRTVC